MKIDVDILQILVHTVNRMEVRHADSSLQNLETDPTATGGFPPGVVKAFRMRMQLIRNAPDERDFYALKSLHYEKLKGTMSHQHSMRLNNQYRLLIEYEERSTEKIAVIVGITDYH